MTKQKTAAQWKTLMRGGSGIPGVFNPYWYNSDIISSIKEEVAEIKKQNLATNRTVSALESWVGTLESRYLFS